MNRLVLIGNGFDLSHKLKTSYSDFVFWYLNESLDSFFKNKTYQDELISLTLNSVNFNFSFPSFTNISELIQFYNQLNKQQVVKFEFKSEYFKNIYNIASSNPKWVDFENSYFYHLKNLANKTNFDLTQLSKFNNEFNYLKIKLEIYLTLTEEDTLIFNPNKFDAILTENFKKKDFSLLSNVKVTKPDSIYVLNFNYTSIFNSYLPSINKIVPTKINFIHGQLNNPENPIIFGFGDEHNKEYKSFEEINNYELFKHIKSFQYLKTSNYQELISFINSNYFQVYILGHSCGISDRTMLKEIFEHEKCLSIKLFYYQRSKNINDNDFTEKTYEISRHFENKGLMRKKVISFDKSEPLI